MSIAKRMDVHGLLGLCELLSEDAVLELPAAVCVWEGVAKSCPLTFEDDAGITDGWRTLGACSFQCLHTQFHC